MRHLRRLLVRFHALFHLRQHTRRRILRGALALAIGGVGVLAFLVLRLPLPWMLGAMIAVTIGAVARLPVAVPATLRYPMTMVIGVMLGSGFTPRFIESITHWLATVVGLIALIIVSGLTCFVYFRRVGGFDRPTAYFAGMPGGLAEMVIAGEEKGGDPRIIALIHTARILIVISILPFLMRLIGGVPAGARPSAGVSVFDAGWPEAGWLVGTAIAGALAGYLLRLPARLLLGPMLVSAIVHVLGWTEFVPPTEIINIAQLVIGTTIGCRFVGTPTRLIARLMVLSLGSTAILLAISAVFAIGVSHLSGFDRTMLLLAYAPGGLMEMSLVALSLGIDVAFVAAHHVIRVSIVMAGSTPMFALFRRI